MPITEFTPAVVEHLNHYVYALVDPRDHKIFYVGKGQGNRVFDHAAAALTVDEGHSLKLSRIQNIRADHREVQVYIIRRGIKSAREAFDIEAAVIDSLRLARLLDQDAVAPDLTNIAGGHHSTQEGLIDADALVAEHHAEPAPEITEPSILIRISRLWTPTIAQMDGGDALYQASSRWWVLNVDRARKAKYAFSVSRGIIRAVYRIDDADWKPGWRDESSDRILPEGSGRPDRYAFDNGEVATEMAHFVGKDVSHHWPPGAQNPITYVNC